MATPHLTYKQRRDRGRVTLTFKVPYVFDLFLRLSFSDEKLARCLGFRKITLDFVPLTFLRFHSIDYFCPSDPSSAALCPSPFPCPCQQE